MIDYDGFLDLHFENEAGQLFIVVNQKPPYESRYLVFIMIHPLYMKMIVVFIILLRAFRCCSMFQAYLDEREKVRITLLVDKYRNRFFHEQLNYVL